MSKKIFYTGDEIKKIAKDLRKNVNIYTGSLEKFYNDVCALQDEKTMCWSGANAYSSIKSCLANIDHDIELFKNVTKCADYVDSVVEQ